MSSSPSRDASPKTRPRTATGWNRPSRSTASAGGGGRPHERRTPMTATATTAPTRQSTGHPAPVVTGRLPASWVLADAVMMTKRNLLKYLRLPNLLVFSTIQPVMFVLLFSQVFGGAIEGALPPGTNYIDFL